MIILNSSLLMHALFYRTVILLMNRIEYIGKHQTFSDNQVNLKDRRQDFR